MLEALWTVGTERAVLAWTFGPLEIAVIGVVAVLIFGKRIPEVARSMGRGITEFKRGIKEDPEDAPSEVENRDATPKSTEHDPAVKS